MRRIRYYQGVLIRSQSIPTGHDGLPLDRPLIGMLLAPKAELVKVVE